MLERRNLPIWPAGRRWAARAAFQTGAPLPRPHPEDEEGEEDPGRARRKAGKLSRDTISLENSVEDCVEDSLRRRLSRKLSPWENIAFPNVLRK